MTVDGFIQLVSLVNLKGGDGLGTIPGILRASDTPGSDHSLCFEGPELCCLKPRPSLLWAMLARRRLQKVNVAIASQTVTERSGWRDMASCEILAFAIRPIINALEPPVIN
jgi:hypothetical protein